MSYGQQMLEKLLRLHVPLEPLINFRPDWLFGMELDFYYPPWRLAIEFQGDQHYVPAFGEKALSDQQFRDGRKLDICKSRGICLIRMDARNLYPNSFYSKLRENLRQKHKRFRRYLIKQAQIPAETIKASHVECREYRQSLIKKFDSPTARYGKAKDAAMKRWLSPEAATTPRLSS